MNQYTPHPITTDDELLYARWQGAGDAGKDPHAEARRARRVEAERRAKQGTLRLENKR